MIEPRAGDRKSPQARRELAAKPEAEYVAQMATRIKGSLNALRGTIDRDAAAATAKTPKAPSKPSAHCHRMPEIVARLSAVLDKAPKRKAV
jgi:hypothetical protein